MSSSGIWIRNPSWSLWYSVVRYIAQSVKKKSVMAQIQGMKWAGQSDLTRMIQAKALTEGQLPDRVHLIVAEFLQMDSPRRLRQIQRAEDELGIEIRVIDTY